MSVEKGDFILINYVLSTKDEGKVIDTNIEEEAKKNNLYDEKKEYKPMLVVIGRKWVIEGLEEQLIGMREGEERVIEVSPEKAFGTRDPNKIKVIPARSLSSKGIIPRKNMEVEIDGKRATVISVGGGRVVLDFNHPLAGKTLIYRVYLTKILDNTKDKIKMLVLRWIPKINEEDIKIDVRAEKADIILSEKALNISNIGIFMKGIIRDIRSLLPEIKRVRFLFSFKLKEAKKSSLQKQA